MNSLPAALDKKLMIHIASELVIVGGITFWLNGKINGQNELVAKLQKENAEIKERLARIESFLSSMGGAPPPPPPTKSRRRHARPSAPDPGTESEEEEILSSSDEEIEI